MNKSSLISAVILLLACNALGSVTNGDDDAKSMAPVRESSRKGLTGGAGQTILGEKPEDVTITSLCALSSPNVAQSRANAMAGLAGVPVSTDPADPGGWYHIPTGEEPGGLQWHHLVTSVGFKMWRGTTALTNEHVANEVGNRLVVHARGRYPVNAYYQRIIVTGLTNVASTTINVATNTAGAEIAFNVNFVGINFGADGVLTSYYDPSIGNWVVSGDDTVYTNGELPSKVPYTEWERFGASVTINADQQTDFRDIIKQFVDGTPSIRVELVRDGNVVNSAIVSAEKPRIGIANGVQGKIDLRVEAGQFAVPYLLFSASNIVGEPWLKFRDGAVYRGQTFPLSKDEPKRFFRLLAAEVPF